MATLKRQRADGTWEYVQLAGEDLLPILDEIGLLKEELNNTTEIFNSKLENLPSGFGGARKVRYIAHRGLSGVAPENSLPAYEMAGRAGAWGAETDVTTTSDGVWVLMHDSTVDRTTDGTGLVSDLTLQEIKELKIDTGNNIAKFPNLKVPTLDEYLLTCKRFNLVPVIEVKSANRLEDYDTFMEIIKKHGYEDAAIVISFSKEALLEIRSRNNKIMLQYLGTLSVEDIEFAKQLGNAGLDVRHTNITKEGIDLAHSSGLLVNTWTVNDLDIANEMIAHGVDYITSDILVGDKL